MIDLENEIFDEVSGKVREKFSSIFMTGEYVKSPSSFPCVSLVEVDNATFRNSQTTEGQENHAAVMYELNVYSNKTKGKKTECKAIMKVIDDMMLSLGFDRPFLNPIPNLEDATIYRMTARYIAIVSKDKVVYRR